MCKILSKAEDRIKNADFGSCGMAQAIIDAKLIRNALDEGIISEKKDELVFTEKMTEEVYHALHNTLDRSVEIKILGYLRMAFDSMENAIKEVDGNFVKDHKGVLNTMTMTQRGIEELSKCIKYDMDRRCGREYVDL